MKVEYDLIDVLRLGISAISEGQPIASPSPVGKKTIRLCSEFKNHDEFREVLESGKFRIIMKAEINGDGSLRTLINTQSDGENILFFRRPGQLVGGNRFCLSLVPLKDGYLGND